MTTLSALLREAAESPDDDGPRLVLADWLDDHGQYDRAEFIRSQLERARLARFDPREAELERRERELFGRHASEWLGEFQKWCLDCQFRRGLLWLWIAAP